MISEGGGATRRADVVFIHGLGGDAFGTWRHGKDDSTSWPHWLAKEFPDVGVWSLGYAASPTKFAWVFKLFGASRDAGHAMSLPDRATQVLDHMLQKGLGARPLLFVCHSLGGLLLKHLLRKSSDAVDPRKRAIAQQTRGVLFLATPHQGAELASLLNEFRDAFGTTVSIEDLRAHDAHLRDLFDWYRGHSAEIRTVTYFEMRSVGGVLPIVKPAFAHAGAGEDPVPLDEDHISIAKPREPEAQVCDAVRALLRDYVLASPPLVVPALTNAAPQPQVVFGEQREVVVRFDGGQKAAERPPIPHQLPLAAEKFFGRDAERAQLAERLRHGESTAVVGPAGMGKTALAREALEDVAGENALDLAKCPYSDGLLYLDLYTLRGDAGRAWSQLANSLRGPGFMEERLARDRANEACRGLRILVIVEGGEEADGLEGRTTVEELYGVLSPENRWLLLTRLTTQARVAETVSLKEALSETDAGDLLDWITESRPLSVAVRRSVLDLVEGHPLALTWAGDLLAHEEEEQEMLAKEWKASSLPRLSDPRNAEHTLQWLFARSVRGLDDASRCALAAAGLLAHAPFPTDAIAAALGGVADGRDALKPLVRRGLLRSAPNDEWRFAHVLAYRFAREESGSDPKLRERLALWVRERFAPILRLGGGVAIAGLGRTLEHAAALLHADTDQRLWRPLAAELLYDISDRLRELGRLDLGRLALDSVADWLAQLLGGKAEEARWRRELAVVHTKIGLVLSSQGDQRGALSLFQESLELRRRLAESDRTNAGWQRDLSVGLERVGDVLSEQGDRTGALALFQESLEVRRRLPESDRNERWQRDQILILLRVGDVLSQQGDHTGALVVLRESLELSRRLAESDRTNAEWQRNLSVSLDMISDVLSRQGDQAAALPLFRESLEVRRRLAELDRTNAEWQRDLAFSLNRIALMSFIRGDRAEALRLAEESLAIDELLATLDPTNAIWQDDVRVSRAFVARLRGDRE